MEISLNESRNIAEKTALTLGCIAFFGVCLSSLPAPGLQIGRVLALLGPVAIILGIIGRYQSSDGSSKWAITVGVITTLYVPTVWLSYVAGLSK